MKYCSECGYVLSPPASVAGGSIVPDSSQVTDLCLLYSITLENIQIS